ncbi:MAG: DUF3575 domain-containing protein [Bacteroidia bacterium]
MKNKILILFVLITNGLYAQLKSNRYSIGINLTPLILQTVDIRVAKAIHQNLTVEAALGFRHQTRENIWEGYPLLSDYVHFKNNSQFAMLSFKFCDRYYDEYPYLALNTTFLRLNEYFADSLDNATQTIYEYKSNKSYNWGISASVGYVFHLKSQLYLDASVQLGYASPKNHPEQYYLPSVGYSMYGTADLFSIKGLMLQPNLVLKYRLK